MWDLLDLFWVFKNRNEASDSKEVLNGLDCKFESSSEGLDLNFETPRNDSLKNMLVLSDPTSEGTYDFLNINYKYLTVYFLKESEKSKDDTFFEESSEVASAKKEIPVLDGNL